MIRVFLQDNDGSLTGTVGSCTGADGSGRVAVEFTEGRLEYGTKGLLDGKLKTFGAKFLVKKHIAAGSYPTRQSINVAENLPRMSEAPQSANVPYSFVPTEEKTNAEEKTTSAWQRWKDKWLRLEMLFFWTLLGVMLGISLGLALYHAHCSQLTIEVIGYPGEMLIRALEELVLPLIVFALMVGILNLRHNPGGTGRIVRWALSYYLLSMILAVGVGISLVELITPGKHTNFNSGSATSCSPSNSTTANWQTQANKSVVDSLLNIGRNFVPTNIIAAAAVPNYLGVIMFAVVFAAAVSTMGERAEPFIYLVEFCNLVTLKIIRYVIAFVPIGVASLIASTILQACNLGGLLKALGLYVGTVLSGLFIHGVVVLPLTMFVLSRQNPFRAVKTFLPALIMGLGTRSSAATLPVTMKCSEDLGCAPSIVQFVIPLGTNVNRDGSALYEAVSVIFILQAHGIYMTAGNIVVVVITATLAAIGAGSIPSSSLVTMITVLQALNYPQFIPDVAMLYAVDWFLDMLRTALNIWGDATAVVVVDTWVNQYTKKHDTLPVTTASSSSSVQIPRTNDAELSDSGVHAHGVE